MSSKVVEVFDALDEPSSMPHTVLTNERVRSDLGPSETQDGSKQDVLVTVLLSTSRGHYSKISAGHLL